ncbi:MAG: LPS export ABC transporter permease LptG [Hyphomicrobiaceae bacterium]
MVKPRLLRRYLALRFAFGILGTFVLCALLIFMIDIVELLRQAGKFGRVPTFRIAWMAILRLPNYTEALLPFCVLVGAIGTLLMFNRKSELTVMRAAGMSAMQFVWPGLAVAFVIGAVSVAVYNPLAAWARGESERLVAEAFGRDMAVLRSEGDGAWLRQEGADGASVLHAAAASGNGLLLQQVMFLQFDTAGHFLERVDGTSAALKDGYWEVSDATVTRTGQKPEAYGVYTVSTALSPERVADALGSAITVSVWELPGLIEVTEKAGLSSDRFRIQYALLLTRPLLLLVMVLLAATVSLRSFRSGGIQTMVATGLIGGFAFFLFAEISRQVGIAGLAPPMLAVGAPVVLGFCGALVVLLHLEDG